MCMLVKDGFFVLVLVDVVRTEVASPLSPIFAHLFGLVGI